LQNESDTIGFQSNPFSVDRTGNTSTLRNYYELGRATALGVWIDIPYNQANFGATAGTWTVPAQTTFAYMLVGKTMMLSFYLASTTISAAPGALIITVPGGFTCSRIITGSFAYYTGSIAATGWSVAQGTTIYLYRDILGTPWIAGQAHVSGTIILNIA
jgi:hypothetical protein